MTPLTNVARFVATFQISDLREQIRIPVRVKDQKWTGLTFLPDDDPMNAVRYVVETKSADGLIPESDTTT